MVEAALVERPLEHRELAEDARPRVGDHGDRAERAAHATVPRKAS